jgi:hypothetical protein
VEGLRAVPALAGGAARGLNQSTRRRRVEAGARIARVSLVPSLCLSLVHLPTYQSHYPHACAPPFPPFPPLFLPSHTVWAHRSFSDPSLNVRGDRRVASLGLVELHDRRHPHLREHPRVVARTELAPLLPFTGRERTGRLIAPQAAGWDVAGRGGEEHKPARDKRANASVHRAVGKAMAAKALGLD